MTEKKEPSETPARILQRFAKRISGAEWKAEVDGMEHPVRVLKLSRIGLEIETDAPLKTDGRYRIRLTHAGRTTSTIFYVLRCPEHGNGAARIYRPAGLFVETLDRPDLPETIPDSP
jgi:hypothetical protein